jgi:hypothetical protein
MEDDLGMMEDNQECIKDREENPDKITKKL